MTDAMRDALEPFAKLAEFVSDDHRDSRPIMYGLSIVLAERLTIGHLRAAKAAIAPQALADHTGHWSDGGKVWEGRPAVGGDEFTQGYRAGWNDATARAAQPASPLRGIPEKLTGELACILEGCDPPEKQTDESVERLIFDYQPTWDRIVAELSASPPEQPPLRGRDANILIALANRIEELKPFAAKSPDGAEWDQYAMTISLVDRDRIIAALRASSPPEQPAAEMVLEQSERLDGTIMQTVRLADGSEIVREQPEADNVKMLLETIDAKNARIGELEEALAKAVLETELESLVKNIQSKILQLKHYRDNEAQIDHARTIAEGRILQAEQILHWIAQSTTAPELPAARPMGQS